MRMLGLLAALALALATPAAAQDYPTKPIRIVVPFGPGTATDIVARTVGSEIASHTGQAVVIDNNPGAEGQIGAQAVAKAAPDGYTLFITTQTTQAINVHVYKSLPYDPVKSFAPVSGLSLGAQVVMVKNELPVKTMGELITVARAQPGKLSFGSGNGSSRGGAELFNIAMFGGEPFGDLGVVERIAFLQDRIHRGDQRPDGRPNRRHLLRLHHRPAAGA